MEKSVVGRTTSGAQASGHITGFIDLTEDLDEQNIKRSDCDVAVRAPYPEERGHMTVSKVSTIPELVRTVFLCRQKKQQTVCSQKPPSVDCPGVYGKGCTGQLRVVYSSFSNGSFWQCSLPPGGERLSCGYRFFPKNDLQNPTVVLAMSDVDKIEVYPAGGAEYFVASCGGVEGILKLAGLDVAAYEGVEISKDHIEFPIKSYQEVSGRLKTLSQISGIDIFPKECDIPQTTKIFFMYVIALVICEHDANLYDACLDFLPAGLKLRRGEHVKRKYKNGLESCQHLFGLPFCLSRWKVFNMHYQERVDV